MSLGSPTVLLALLAVPAVFAAMRGPGTRRHRGRIEPLQAAALARATVIPVDTVALGTAHGILGYGPFAPRVAPDSDAPGRSPSP